MHVMFTEKDVSLLCFSGFIFYTHSIWPWSIKGNIRVSGCFIFDSVKPFVWWLCFQNWEVADSKRPW
jgi:hypothetical protein